MELLQIIIIAGVIFGTVVFVHELGHFLAARLTGVRIISFSFGFGPRLIRAKCCGTEFCLSLLPLGGYVIPALGPQGDDAKPMPKLIQWLVPLGASEREEIAKCSSLTTGTMAQATFIEKLFFFSNGLIFNILFAYVVFVGLFYQRGTFESFSAIPRVGTVIPGSTAFLGGLREGDIIVSLDDIAINSWGDFQEAVRHYDGHAVLFRLVRSIDGRTDRTEAIYAPNQTNSTDKNFRKGPWDFGFNKAIDTTKITLVEAMKFAAEGMYNVALEFMGISQQREIDVRSTNIQERKERPWGVISGFLEIGTSGSQSARSFFATLIVLSIIVVILNAVPYPAFDGGQILLLIVEKIGGKKLPTRIKERIAYFGLASTILLTVIAFGSDLITFFW